MKSIVVEQSALEYSADGAKDTIPLPFVRFTSWHPPIRTRQKKSNGRKKSGGQGNKEYAA
jgi:hypothetical protein